MSKQSKGLKRDVKEKYYTKSEIVKLCMENISHIKKNDIIIEPSAGNGAFIESIKKITKNYYFYDLYPENKEIKTIDYLEYKHTEKKKTHVIGNPPFGKQSSLAISFIKKSVEFAESISFILPKSFKKDSRQKFFPTKFHLIKEIDLPKNCFLVNNEQYDVPCIFQVWIKKNIDRIVKKKLEPIHFNFVKKTDNPDISFRRVGGTAGKIDTVILDKSEQSHYFIKFTNNFNDTLLQKLKKLTFENSTHTVAAKSISKQELMTVFNPLLDNIYH
jgi:hypothetical protein